MAPTTEEPVKKRGRGRPPKAGGAEKKAYVPTGRPRGRPKGSGGVKKSTAAKKNTTASGSGRGRPRKSDVSEGAGTPGKKSGTPGRRGRPRKSDASTAAPTPKKGPKSKKADPAVEDKQPLGESSSSDEEEKVPEDAGANTPSNAEDSAEE